MLTTTPLSTGSPMPDPNRALQLPWYTLAAEHFDGPIEVGDDLLRIEISPKG